MDLISQVERLAILLVFFLRIETVELRIYVIRIYIFYFFAAINAVYARKNLIYSRKKRRQILYNAFRVSFNET